MWSSLQINLIWLTLAPNADRRGCRCHLHRPVVAGPEGSLLTKACFLEPMVNRTYADMAAHHGTAIIPARPCKPRDKAQVEVVVQVVQRWIPARLRNRRFFLAELNVVIPRAGRRDQLPADAGKGTTRPALFDQFDRPALLPSAPTAYDYAD